MRRPRPDKWSALEYGCHVRDVLRLYDYRLGLMLTEDDPLYPNWDQDETAVADRYDTQDPAAVGGGARTPRRRRSRPASAPSPAISGNGRAGAATAPSFTVETFASYFIHDPVHHLYDVTGQRAREP